MDSKVWKEGSFSVSKSLLIENLTVGTVTCEISLPGTSYREVRRRKVPNVPIEFVYSSSGSSTFSNNFQQSIVNCLKLFIFIYFTQVYICFIRCEYDIFINYQCLQLSSYTTSIMS